jgi:quercetin dioxygenase-like cupin family protein
MTNNNYCFCELAPLYGLGLLSESECSWVEQQILECPDLAAELAIYQDAAAAVAYCTSPKLPSPTLKDRLFERLELPVSQAESPLQPIREQASPPLVTVRSQQLHWRRHPVPGVEIAILHRDRTRRKQTAILRAAPGVRYPLHRHTATEEIYMLSGDLVVEDEVYNAGDYIRSEANSAHAPYTVGGCMFFVRSSIDDEYPELITSSR